VCKLLRGFFFALCRCSGSFVFVPLSAAARIFKRSSIREEHGCASSSYRARSLPPISLVILKVLLGGDVSTIGPAPLIGMKSSCLVYGNPVNSSYCGRRTRARKSWLCSRPLLRCMSRPPLWSDPLLFAATIGTSSDELTQLYMSRTSGPSVEEFPAKSANNAIIMSRSRCRGPPSSIAGMGRPPHRKPPLASRESSRDDESSGAAVAATPFQRQR
jgi:hypothetical protein